MTINIGILSEEIADQGIELFIAFALVPRPGGPFK